MTNFFKSDKGIIFILILIIFALLPFFYMKQGLLLIDTGREFYIPSQILQGKVLYKDIFNNMYAPFAYLFNAFIMSVFGQKLNVLYHCGIINSVLIISLLYLISREFLSKFVSFLFSLVIVFELVYPVFLYNSNLTYTFAIVYALSSFLLSLLLLIKYIKNDNKLFLYLCCFFAGVSISCKYEFLLYIPVIFYVLIFIKHIKIKEMLISCGCFLSLPIMCLLYLIWQGLSINDIAYTIKLTHNIMNSPTLKLFFSNMNAAMLSDKNILFCFFAALPLINCIIFILNLKKIKENKALMIFFVSCIMASTKSFFSLNINHMGIYIFPLCLLMFIILLSNLKIKSINKYTVVMLISLCFLFAIQDFIGLKDKTYKLETPKGTIYTYPKDGRIIDYCTDYILKNTQESDKVVILPEGVIINYLTGHKSNDMYYCIHTLFYEDIFGEDKIISDFRNNLPEYFIILPILHQEYGKSKFGLDYATNFYEIIEEEYNLIENNNNIEIYKRKK